MTEKSQPGGMLNEFVGHAVVVDLRSPFVCLGTLKRVDGEHLELRDADFHDLRDTETSRENYVAASRATGIKRNRKRVLIVRTDVVAVARLEDVVDE
jgi:hypothetical protein